MASSASPLFEFKERFTAIKKSCLDSDGLTDDQFDQLAASAFRQYKEDRQRRQYFGIFYWCKKVTFVISMTIITLTALGYVGSCVIDNSKAVRKFGLTLIHDYEILYKANRIVRKMALPLHGFVDISKGYRWECLLSNPFQVTPPPDCSICENSLDIEVILSNERKLVDSKMETLDPFVIINDDYYSKHLFTYNEFRSVITDNQEVMKSDMCRSFTYSGPTDMDIIERIVKSNYSEILSQSVSQGWMSCSAEAARVIRKLYPRPTFLPASSEVSLEKYMYVLSPNTSKVDLPKPVYRANVVAQLTGRSEILISPIDDCKSNCTQASRVFLNTGELFVYAEGGPWTLSVMPVGDILSLLHIMQNN